MGATKTVLIYVGLVAGTGVFYYLSVILHELGHVIAALAVGWKPTSACLGQGKKQTLCRIGDFRFKIGSSLLGGMATAFARNLRGFRTAQFTFAAGGPLATAAIAAALWLGVAASEREDGFMAQWHEWLFILFLLECWLLALNLWPRHIYYDHAWIPNDGLLMWRSLRMSAVPKHYAGHAVGLAEHIHNDGRQNEARQVIEEAIAQLTGPEHEQFGLHAAWINLLFNAGREDMAIAECARILETASSVEERVQLLDELACIPLFSRRLRMLGQALSYIDEALTEAPDMITLKGTKGSLLIENGDVAAGMDLLKEVREISESANDQAITAYYLALGYFKSGNVEKAKSALCEAKEQYPDCVVAAHVEAEISGSRIEPVNDQATLA